MAVEVIVKSSAYDIVNVGGCCVTGVHVDVKKCGGSVGEISCVRLLAIE